MEITQKKWQSKAQLTDLLAQLVNIPSVSGSAAEVEVAQHIAKEIGSLPYFQSNPDHVALHPTGDGRFVVTGLVKKAADVRNTVILVSHFDVVDVQDYGKWKHHAFHPKELTQMYVEDKHDLPPEVQRDLASGEWLFGRGTMDMKCGLALHMSMLEQAVAGEFAGNLLLLTVPDEEVNSVGMRAAVPVLLELAKQHGLDYSACLNSEPIFPRYPGDENKYIYSGSIGKVLPGFYCYGKETHVGEPLSGLNASNMVSQIVQELELNADFCEVVGDEVTPPPTCLYQRDLKKEYSVQIPDRAVTLFNLFVMEKPMAEAVSQLRQLSEKVARQIEQNYAKHASAFNRLQHSSTSEMKVNVLSFDELLAHATETHGSSVIDQMFQRVLEHRGQKDDRALSIELVDQFSLLCKELSPMIVLFFAPPYYPANSSRNHPKIKQAIEEMIAYAGENHGIKMHQQNYFPGISDLSYAGLQESTAGLQPFVRNMPMWEKGYALPLAELEELNLPIINLGPVGKDAHKWTERLDTHNAFHTLADMLPVLINKLLR